MSAEADNTFDLLHTGQPTDNDATRAVLVRELRMAKGFTLIFAVSRAGEARARLMEAVKRDLPDFRIQEVPVRREIPHLLHVLRSVLDDPAPNAVFVYGMENWISGDAPPRSIPFILNLNASRNNFMHDCPCPVVFWIPEFLFGMIAEGAPDFFSVRSGVHYFAEEPDAPTEQRNAESLGMTAMDYTALWGLLPEERQERRREMETLLQQIRDLPEAKRDLLAEARTLNELTNLNYVEAAYEDALSLAERALEIREQILGPNHPDTAESLNGLANIYAGLYRYNDALPLYERALEIREQILGPNHPDTAGSLNALVILYNRLNRYNDALPLAERALAIHEQMLGPHHPDTAQSLNSLANTYSNLSRYNDALPLLERALAIREQTRRPRHLDTAESLNNLAFCYINLGRYNDALPLYERALEICEQILGPQHPITNFVWQNMELLRKEMELPL